MLIPGHFSRHIDLFHIPLCQKTPRVPAMPEILVLEVLEAVKETVPLGGQEKWL